MTNSILSKALPALALALLFGCSSGGGGGSSTLPVGTVATDPVTGLRFIVESNRGGQASSMKIVGQPRWGRLVDIYEFDSSTQQRAQVFRDFVIGDDIRSNGSDFLLERNAVTESENLVILHPFGTPEFSAALSQVEANLQQFLDKSLDPAELPPFTAAPRNSAIVIQFDDVLDPASVDASTVQLLTGYPPTQPYECRVFPDPNHGDLVDGKFRSTRVVLDLTTSRLESQQFNLIINSLGLPPAITKSQPNVVIRIPSRENSTAAQFKVLENLSSHGVSFNGNGSNDPFSPTLDVVRGFRSGGEFKITGDANNGFLVDEIAPDILGSQTTTVTRVQSLGGDEFEVDLLFQTAVCALQPRLGDVLDLPNHVLEVTQLGNPPVSGQVNGVQARLLFGDPATLIPVVGLFKTAYDPGIHAIPGCFVRFSPNAQSAPVDGVAVDASMIVTFSEPMDPATVEALDSLTLQYVNAPNTKPTYRNVVGHIDGSNDLREFSFVPETDLNHPAGSSEPYVLTVVSGAGGVTDLAGNPLAQALPPVQFQLGSAEPTIKSRGVAFKFDSTDEDQNGGPEVRGQFLYDLNRQLVKPRSVTRFSAVADNTVPIVGSMVQFTAPIQTPLSNLGSRMMTVWRHHDLGFGLLDESTHNLDVEGLAWMPFSPQGLNIDSFSEFSIALAHSKRLPDEALNTGLLPQYIASGIVAKYADNVLDPTNDPLTVVHAKQRGYQVLSSDTFIASSGNVMAPWPWNRNLSAGQQPTRWTFRDTSILAIGGPNGAGSDTQRFNRITGAGMVGFYPANNVPTIGLPMLMDFKTWPDTQASGLNGFLIAIAINSSAQPFFRAFSTGGVRSSGVPKIVLPDQAITADGGISPATGFQTPPQDNAFYYGQGDFVVRLSRLHTIWIDTLGTSTFVPPVFEPSSNLWPSGTSMTFAFRGASSITSGNLAFEDASNMDAYGNSYTTGQNTALGKPTNLTFTPSHFGGTGPNDRSWHNTLTGLNGARYVQIRVTFVSNPDTALSPELSALGVAFTQ